MAAKKSTRPFRAGNSLDPKLLLRIWRHLDRGNREQLLTAAFGMLQAQVALSDPEGSRRPAALVKVLRNSCGRAPFDKVLLSGAPGKYMFSDIPLRAKAVGRWQREARWMVNGNLIAPDWREVRSGYSRGSMPDRAA